MKSLLLLIPILLSACSHSQKNGKSISEKRAPFLAPLILNSTEIAKYLSGISRTNDSGFLKFGYFYMGPLKDSIRAEIIFDSVKTDNLYKQMTKVPSKVTSLEVEKADPADGKTVDSDIQIFVDTANPVAGYFPVWIINRSKAAADISVLIDDASEIGFSLQFLLPQGGWRTYNEPYKRWILSEKKAQNIKLISGHCILSMLAIPEGAVRRPFRLRLGSHHVSNLFQAGVDSGDMKTVKRK